MATWRRCLSTLVAELATFKPGSSRHRSGAFFDQTHGRLVGIGIQLILDPYFQALTVVQEAYSPRIATSLNLPLTGYRGQFELSKEHNAHSGT
ncbi:MAG: hypothetical protein WBA99_02870 [Nodosilinea sp.]